MRSWGPLAAVVVVLHQPAAASAQRVCAEGVSVHNGTFDANLVDTLAANSVTCAHVRMRQDVWTGPDDPTPRGSPPRTMLEAWDRLIDYYRERDIDVYLEVGADAIGRSVHELRDPGVRARYAAFFVRVLQRYVRQVKAFELADGGDRTPPVGVVGRNALAPVDVASLALTVRQAVERDLGGSLCNRHQTALGGVRFDSEADGGVNYLRAVYAAGLGEELTGGLWTPYRDRTGHLPFDAVAMHSLPAFTPLLNARGQGEGAALAPADAVGDVLARFEGGRTARPVWITAGGLPSDGSEAQNVRQRDWLIGYFNTAVRADLSTPVEMASWYAFIEPPWDPGGWGFYDDGIPLRSNERTAGLAAFGSAMAHNRPQPNALLRWNDGSLRLAPGEIRRVHLQVTNHGPIDARGLWRAGDRIRVGAAPTCPFAEDANEVRWTGFPTGGNSGAGPFDGRVEVSVPTNWFAGASRVVEWDITAPPDPGSYSLSARLIWGEDQWFGQNATTTVIVVAPLDAAADVVDDVGGAAVEDVLASEVSTVDVGLEVGGEIRDAAGLDQGTDAAGIADDHGAPMDLGAFDADDGRLAEGGTPSGPARRGDGCGCAVQGSGRVAPWGLGLLVALLRRRRRPSWGVSWQRGRRGSVGCDRVREVGVHDRMW